MYPENPPEPTTEEYYEDQLAQAVAHIKQLQGQRTRLVDLLCKALDENPSWHTEASQAAQKLLDKIGYDDIYQVPETSCHE